MLHEKQFDQFMFVLPSLLVTSADNLCKLSDTHEILL